MVSDPHTLEFQLATAKKWFAKSHFSQSEVMSLAVSIGVFAKNSKQQKKKREKERDKKNRKTQTNMEESNKRRQKLESFGNMVCCKTSDFHNSFPKPHPGSKYRAFVTGVPLGGATVCSERHENLHLFVDPAKGMKPENFEPWTSEFRNCAIGSLVMHLRSIFFLETFFDQPLFALNYTQFGSIRHCSSIINLPIYPQGWKT